ncbi:S-layer homology domain-containing protein [Geobacillus sp. C56-T2]|uniref:S-layer homology domain-containing protein n=1 Tax=Geobacillus sp. C56-T2 TaxID=600773 RepID=UPI0011A11E69|nr:S-layer homology domain-containing protein [Geobacillus sp. C56-T2]TWG29508.1 putative YkwD family protein [Geobacillus sp. C56-T2]
MNAIKRLTIIVTALLLCFALFPPNSSAKSKFKDIPDNYWAKKEIEELVSKGIINGYPDGNFKPEQYVTRAQTAVIIGKTMQIDTENRKNPGFADVKTKDSAYPYIAALVERGIFSKGKKFNPNNPLTREQLAKILVEAFALQGTTKTEFKDVPKNHWAYKYINTLVATGITTGKTSDKFDPTGKVTRAQMAVFVKRALDYQEKQIANLNPFVKEVVDLVNKERAKKKLPPLKLALDVTRVAQLKAEDMVKNDYYDHISPVYGDPYTMLSKFNIKCKFVGENIAGGEMTPEEVMTDWMNSPGHRDNILDPLYTEIGVGVANIGSVKGKPIYYWVQMFVTR